MAHCSKCGAIVAGNAAFCGGCGAAQATAAPAAASPQPSATAPGIAQTGMDENVAGFLCYLIGWITGVIMLVTDKRPFVRFHATQSIVVFGGLHILWYVLRVLFSVAVFTGGWKELSLDILLYRILDFAAIVLWALLMIKAYQGERIRVPFAADLAEQIFGRA